MPNLLVRDLLLEFGDLASPSLFSGSVRGHSSCGAGAGGGDGGAFPALVVSGARSPRRKGSGPAAEPWEGERVAVEVSKSGFRKAESLGTLSVL